MVKFFEVSNERISLRVNVSQVNVGIVFFEGETPRLELCLTNGGLIVVGTSDSDYPFACVKVIMTAEEVKNVIAYWEAVSSQ